MNGLHPDTILDFEEMQEDEGTEAALMAFIRGLQETQNTPFPWSTFTSCTCPLCVPKPWN